MERNNSKNLPFEPKLFEIPIEEYEKDMNEELSKEKKNKILNLFKNCNKLRSEEEFKEIKEKLHLACQKCELDLIKIYLSETIEDDSKSFLFKIDETNQTASLFKVHDSIEHVVIPQTVKHESTDFLITSICGFGKKVKLIEFSEDSAVKTVYRNVFSILTKIKEIHFPASLMELKDEWCTCTDKLTKITISPLNGQFKLVDDKYLLGKSDQNKDEFDVLLFASRDIKEIFIPSNIKIISSSALSKCRDLAKIEILPDSNLQTIGSYAFSSSNISEFFIPSKVSEIGRDAFSNCKNLTKIDFDQNSILKAIEPNIILFTKIKEIYFPENLKELKEGWCCGAHSLTKITISPLNGQFKFIDDKYLIGKCDKSNDEFDTFLFASHDIKEISIPSNIKIIASFALSYCRDLTKIDIPPNSNLQIIGKNAFTSSNINEIFIPSKVSRICEGTFASCSKLTTIEFAPDSNLQTIESHAFSLSNIKEIYFPANLKELKEGWCFGAHNLTKIIISPSNGQFIFKDNKYLIGKSDQNNNEFDILLFVNRKIKKISIPSNIKIISSYAFSRCHDLSKVEISPNSNLETIGSYAFSSSKLKEIYIPSKVSKINECAFYFCNNLTKIDFAPDSNLQTIEPNTFSFSNIKEIFIPSKVSKICESAFVNCNKLAKVGFASDSNLQTIEIRSFYCTKIESIVIPSKVSKIYEGAFQYCNNFQIIEISEESELESLPLSAFNECQKLIIMIPSSLEKLIHSIKSI